MKSFNESVKIPGGAVWLMNSIAEFKGKQELYKKQSPEILKTLVENAIVESAESSNRIEGIEVDQDRLKPILLQDSKPRTRPEEEVVGYKNALNLIHTKYSEIDIVPDTTKLLHKMCVEGISDAGQWKIKDNDVIRKNVDGSVEIIFKPVSAVETLKYMDNLCLLYKTGIDQWKYPDLYAVACLVLDFLCVHPFRDGNGRVSRLITLLALYKQGYEVGKYISLEKIIEDSKEEYYKALHKSSLNWHEGKHDIEPWLYYLLSTINIAYKRFEERATKIKVQKGAKTGFVKKVIDEQIGEFSYGDIVRLLPGVGKDMIKLVFKQLEKEKKIVCLGKGQSAKWKKVTQVNE
jgi:Fic family protein